ncbi:Altered inheritance of mitochondria protein 41 [Mycena venus]|uniref:Altered inheritance of mitochondria protein 41 n=1 Tax=Mycena venus TaxID=2733690 RepID=A0A8H6YNR3_9AGAR|nr:Altered inheritance of mitochondria protein 41 [Mycena venus]
MAARLAASFRSPPAPCSTTLPFIYCRPAGGFRLTDVRGELAAAVKSAMKNKDIKTSITLRAVLAEVHSADKTANSQIDSSAIKSILKKAAARRTEAAAQYAVAGRPELAEKETSEAKLLSQFLPPVLSEEEVDNTLRKILEDLPKDKPPQQKLGSIFKVFYTVVDKSTVDSEMVKRRLDVLLKTPN